MYSRLDEEHYVENDFLRKLQAQGWKIYRQDIYDPESARRIVSFDENLEPEYAESEPFRKSFSEILLNGELQSSLKVINPFLDDEQVSEVIRRIQVPDANSFIAINREFHELLTSNTSVVENKKTGEKSPTVRYIDFEHPEKNLFVAVSQFKVSIPGTENHIIPDIVLFVNGIPLVVVECKSPAITDPIYEAIVQLMRYSERRGTSNREGNQKLFYYNLFQIATSREEAVSGTITSTRENFVEWKDTYPYPKESLGKYPSSQDILIRGMLSKENLLDLLHTFTVFRDGDQGVSKIVARYHQFRAVKKIVKRIKEGKTPFEKGGIIWHTQGSGKSLTMIFTVRELYHNKEFGGFKIIFVTDRKDLERQLTKTSKSVGFTVRTVRTIKGLQETLRADTPELIMAMISKFNETEMQEKFPTLNESQEILVMIDEAHRSEYKELGANLRVALPNSIKVAFTGTPIDKTEEAFGEYIDKYTLKESVADKVTVPIFYEGRVRSAEITDKEAMNKKFKDVFKNYTGEDKRLIMGRYTWRSYLEAEKVIADKARDIIDHYVNNIFVNGFKAQVVTVSRVTAMRYKSALENALKQKITELERHSDGNIDLDILKKLKITAIFSASQNDLEEYKEFTNQEKQKQEIASFKLPFNSPKDRFNGNIGIIVVNNMLITGFDAPIEQVMYLDNVIREHNLLQAIARVNRVYKNKGAGYVIDYVGVFNHLKKALENYYKRDINEILTSVVNKEKAKDSLVSAYNAIVEMFAQIGVHDFMNEPHICINLLIKDEKRRNEFYNLVNKFNRNMDIVLPDPYALKYKDALKQANFIKQAIRNILRQGTSIKEASAKVRAIVEEFIVSKGIEIKIYETNVLDPEFLENLKAYTTPEERAKALEVAVRNYTREHYTEDPELYGRFTDRLEEILQKYKENWEKIEEEIILLRKDIKRGRSGEKDIGLDKQKEMPFFGILVRNIYGKVNYEDLSDTEIEFLKNLTKDLVEEVKRQSKIVDFWENDLKQKSLRSFINLKLLRVAGKSGQAGVMENNVSDVLKHKHAMIAQNILETAYRIYGVKHG